jgi:hypothetical protein
MRDIRKDLHERLNAILAEQDVHRQKVAELESQKNMLTTLLEQEQHRWGAEISTVRKSQDLTEIIRDIMSDGGEWHGGTVADVLLKRGYDVGDGKPGRIIHFTLLGMAKRDLVESVGNGKWKLKQRHDLVNHDAA